MSALETTLSDYIDRCAVAETAVRDLRSLLARTRDEVVTATERAVRAEQESLRFYAETVRLQRLLEEATRELPDGLTRSERAQRDEYQDNVETLRREGLL